MLGYLIFLFTVVPACELALLIKIGTIVGVGNTLLLIIVTGVVGAYLARLQGFIILTKIQDNLNRGIMPSTELMDGFMILVGGIVLLTPGLITDVFGFFLLIPWTRNLIKLWLQKKFKDMIARGEAVSFRQEPRRRDRYDDIDLN